MDTRAPLAAALADVAAQPLGHADPAAVRAVLRRVLGDDAPLEVAAFNSAV